MRYLLWPSILFATPRESVMLDCGFIPLMSSLSDSETRGCAVATRDKTTVLVPAGARIVYFMQSSFNVVVCCFEFTLWVGFAT